MEKIYAHFNYKKNAYKSHKLEDRWICTSDFWHIFTKLCWRQNKYKLNKTPRFSFLTFSWRLERSGGCWGMRSPIAFQLESIFWSLIVHISPLKCYYLVDEWCLAEHFLCSLTFTIGLIRQTTFLFCWEFLITDILDRCMFVAKL